MMNGYDKLSGFNKLLIVILIVILFDYGLGLIIRKMYFKQTYGVCFRSSFAIDSTKADILILGSSRAAHHYVPTILEDRLNLTAYNAGRDGISLLYDYALFKTIVQRHKPSLVIFDIMPSSLDYRSMDYDRLSVLLPYYRDYREIRAVLDLRSSLEIFKNYSSIYPFNSMLVDVVLNLVGYNKIEYSDINGFVPLRKTMGNTKLDSYHIGTGKTDINKVKAVKDMLELCKSSSIKVVFVFSPIWHDTKNSFNDEQFSALAEAGIFYIDFSNDSLFMNHPDLFADKSHLNEAGASTFTDLMVEKCLK